MNINIRSCHPCRSCDLCYVVHVVHVLRQRQPCARHWRHIVAVAPAARELSGSILEVFQEVFGESFGSLPAVVDI